MLKIICINKDGGDHDDPHKSINNFGWTNISDGYKGNYSLSEMIDYLEGGGKAFVEDKYGNRAYLIVKDPVLEDKYVKTKKDGKETNNLLNLPEC